MIARAMDFSDVNDFSIEKGRQSPDQWLACLAAYQRAPKTSGPT
jgi:hypothetical protein